MSLDRIRRRGIQYQMSRLSTDDQWWVYLEVAVFRNALLVSALRNSLTIHDIYRKCGIFTIRRHAKTAFELFRTD